MAKPCKKHSMSELLSTLWEASSDRARSKYSAKQLDLYSSQLQIVVARLRGLRNMLQPIHALPSEVLGKIFAFCQVNFPAFLPCSMPFLDEDEHLHWLKLLQVCRHWRGIIAKSPSLWCHVDHTVQPDKFLKRSLSAPISVYLGVRDDTAFPNSILDSISSQTHRFSQLHISLEAFQGDPSVLSRFNGLAPFMESLTIEVNYVSPFSQPVLQHPPVFTMTSAPPDPFDSSTGTALLGGEYSTLRYICIQYFIPSLSKMTNLTHVCLYDQRPERVSSSIFLDFLDSNPGLQYLALVNAGPDVAIQSDLPVAPPSRISRLNHLEVLDIGEWISCARVSQFLSHLDLPKTTKLYIWGNFLINAPGEDIGGIMPVELNNLKNVTSVTEWCFVRDDWPRLINHRYPGEIISGTKVPIIAFVDDSMCMRGLPYAAQIASGISRFPLSNVTHMSVREVSDPSNQLDVNAWSGICERMAQLQSIALLSTSIMDRPRSLLLALASTLPNKSSSPMFCPNLQSLLVEDNSGTYPLFAVMAFLESRSSSGHRLKRLTVTLPESWYGHGFGGDSMSGEEAEASFRTVEKFVDELHFIRKSEESLEDKGTWVNNAQGGWPSVHVGKDTEETECPPALPLGWPSKAFLWTRRRSTR